MFINTGEKFLKYIDRVCKGEKNEENKQEQIHESKETYQGKED